MSSIVVKIISIFAGISHSQDTIKFDCCYSNLVVIAHFHMYPFQWYSLCFSAILRSYREANAAIVVNGKFLNVQIVKNELGEIFDVDGQGSFILGQDQDNFASSFDPTESLSAYLADFVFFNHSLHTDEILQWTIEYYRFGRNPLIGFNDLHNFEVKNVQVYIERDVSTFHEKYYPFYRFFSVEVTFHKASDMCHSLGGAIVTPTNKKRNDELFDLTNTDKLCKFSKLNHDLIWLGIQTEFNNSKVPMHYLTKDHLNFSYYHLNGDQTSQNNKIMCTSFYGCETKSFYWHRRWMSLSCNARRRVFCRFPTYPRLEVRGLCPESRFDKTYFLNNTVVNPNLIGFLSTIIEFVEGNDSFPSVWKMTNYYGDLAILKLKTGEFRHVTGKHKWKFVKDLCGNRTQELVFTSCGQNHYTCNDGSCFPVNDRCNYEMNCPDGSDEFGCDLLVLPGTAYLPSVPPPKIENKENLEIEVNVQMKRIVDFSLDDFTLQTDMAISTSWVDSLLLFKNLRNSISRNTISMDRKKLPWLPTVRVLGFNFSVSEETLRLEMLNVERISPPLSDDVARIDEGKKMLNVSTALS